jgi:N-acetylmuramoyl-L-alanine amidase
MLKIEGIRYKFINQGQKDMPLNERTRFANSIYRKYKQDEVLLISIHSDGVSNSQAHGYSCYTSIGDTISDKYAEAYLEEMEKLFPGRRMRTDTSDGDRDKEKSLAMTRDTIGAAILTENFFHTNEYECKEILMKKSGQRKIAQAHLNMIKRFV